MVKHLLIQIIVPLPIFRAELEASCGLLTSWWHATVNSGVVTRLPSTKKESFNTYLKKKKKKEKENNCHQVLNM